MKTVAVIGAGGHGRVIASVILDMEKFDHEVKFCGFIDQDAHVKSALGPVIGRDEDVKMLVAEGKLTHFIVGLGAIKGGQMLRDEIYTSMQQLGASPFTAISPSAHISDHVQIGPGTAIIHGATVNTGTRILENTIINTGAIIDHDCYIGKNVHIAPGCTLSGDVTVGDSTLIGVGSCVRQSIKIGEGCTIGAGSVVVKNVADETTVFGNPARPA